MYIKDFDWRNDDKKYANEHKQPYVKHGEIWLCKIWVNVWSEVDGKASYLRPVLIISEVWSMLFVAPLTTKIHHGRYFYQLQSVEFVDIQWQTITSTVMLGQCRIIDGRRLLKKKSKVSHQELNEIKKQLNKLYLPIFHE